MRAGSLRHSVELSRERDPRSVFNQDHVSPAGEVFRRWHHYATVRAATVTAAESGDGPALKLRMRHHGGVAVGDRAKLGCDTYTITAIEQSGRREIEITLGEVTP